jgi:hypothetical protein
VRKAFAAIATVVKMMDPKKKTHATVDGGKFSKAPCWMTSAMSLPVAYWSKGPLFFSIFRRRNYQLQQRRTVTATLLPIE